MTAKKTWMYRTAEYRKAACMEILHRPWSDSEAKAIKRVAAKYNGRTLPGGKHLHLSAVTLKRVWQIWKRDPSDKAFNMGYPEGQRDPMSAWMVHLLESYAIQRALTLNELHRALKAADAAFPWSRDSFYRHLPDETKQRIAKAVKLQRQEAALYKEKKKLEAQP